jgi:FG-GAP-like repeat
MRDASIYLATVLAAVLFFTIIVEGQGHTGETPSAGVRFDRIEIAEHSGDVKLVGDLDGDGLLDLVVGGFRQDPLTWWRWPDLRPTEIATARVEFTTDGVLADIDGDGDLDVVTADGPDGDNLVWFANPRPDAAPTDGTLWQRRTIGALGGWGKDIRAGDFDGDGRTDIVARAPEAAMVFFQDQPSLWIRETLPPFELGEEGMGIGDINGDGTPDLVLHGVWARNPGGSAARDPKAWQSFPIGDFNPAFKALVVDLDQDGRGDVLTSSSEHTADVAWFRPADDPTGPWARQVIAPSIAGAHTLQAADIDRDGDLDVVVGQMHTTDTRELAIHYNLDGRATRWTRQKIDDVGLHNGVVADIDQDGDFDIFGANWAGNPPVRLWINRLDPSASIRPLDRWTHSQVTAAHVRAFGLAFADVDGDGRTDIVSGPFWYRQPAVTWDEEWSQTPLALGVDAIAALDLDGEGRPEIIAQSGGGPTLELVWLEATDDVAQHFRAHPIGEVPAASHELGAQGHALAQIRAGGRPELAVSSGAGVFAFEIPTTPAAGPWPRTRIAAAPSDEGMAFGDIDGDGLVDLAATTGEAKEVAWWRNPGDGNPDWERRAIAAVPEMVYPDRVAVADLDGDGRLDVVVTEENGAGEGARASWWRNSGTEAPVWKRHEITARGSLNSLSAADMNADGRPDLVMAEHRGALRLSIWTNLGAGRFVEHLVSEGVESHLGTRSVDLDGDGDLDIVSIAWDEPSGIHVWRNDNIGGQR